MKPFITPKLKDQPTNNVERFIDMFNERMSRGYWDINSNVRRIPVLNDDEYEIAVRHALKQGLLLSRDSNGYFTTYTLKRLL